MPSNPSPNSIAANNPPAAIPARGPKNLDAPDALAPATVVLFFALVESVLELGLVLLYFLGAICFEYPKLPPPAKAFCFCHLHGCKKRKCHHR